MRIVEALQHVGAARLWRASHRAQDIATQHFRNLADRRSHRPTVILAGPGSTATCRSQAFSQAQTQERLRLTAAGQPTATSSRPW